MAEMTDLQIATRSASCANRAMNALQPIVRDREHSVWIGEIHAYWLNRIVELDPAGKEARGVIEKDAEEPHTDLDERFGRLMDRMGRLLAIVDSANGRLERLEAKFDRHDHGMNTRTGPPNIDRESGDEN